MHRQLKIKDSLFTGSMLFGLFFGAGNLIFPVNIGQNAGANVLSANFGFLLTAVGLPFLGIVAIGLSGTSGVNELASKVHPVFGKMFTILLYLTIGPCFAMPRLATTAFTIGISPFFSSTYQGIALLLFSALFFLIAYFLSRKSGALLAIVGKFLNPLFLALLGFLLLIVFIRPLGTIAHAPTLARYEHHAFTEGFKNGYNTMDLLASLAFGSIVMTTLQKFGVKTKKDLALATIKSSAVVVLLMSVLYTALSISGTLSLGKFPVSENGGIALAQLSHYYLGIAGSLLLAAIICIACLKTAVGLTVAFSETTVTLFPRMAYKKVAIFSVTLPAIFANVGLSALLNLTIPILMFLYPLAVALVVLVFVEHFTHYRLYKITIAFTGIPALLDALASCPESITRQGIVQPFLHLAHALPFATLGMSWIVPCLIGLLLGILFCKKRL